MDNTITYCRLENAGTRFFGYEDEDTAKLQSEITKALEGRDEEKVKKFEEMTKEMETKVLENNVCHLKIENVVSECITLEDGKIPDIKEHKARLTKQREFEKAIQERNLSYHPLVVEAVNLQEWQEEYQSLKAYSEGGKSADEKLAILLANGYTIVNFAFNREGEEIYLLEYGGETVEINKEV